MAKQQAAPVETLPKKIGPYKIESLLNKSGMNLLYLGIHPETHETLAIKVLSAKYLAQAPMIERFLKEAEIIALTNHPNIIKLYGQGRWEQGVYIATEFIQGISLRQMILLQAMSLMRAVDVVLQIARALLHLHSNGIIHRDLKPENILLTDQGGVKVIDFGISLLYTDKMAGSKKSFEGTPFYMSPEQRKDPLNVSFSVDIYALGIITYELVLGRLSHGIVHLSDMPRGLQKILAKALAPTVQERYDDIVDFIKDLSVYRASDEINKDKRGSDYLAELTEDLKASQVILAPKLPPDWPHFNLTIASNCTAALSSIYYDFFTQKEGHYTIAMGESMTTGVGGLLQVAILKGIVRSLAALIDDPVELVQQIHARLLEAELKENFAFALLTIKPAQDFFSYISCGAIPLCHVPCSTYTPHILFTDNPPLGNNQLHEIVMSDGKCAIGDILFLHTFQTSSLHTQDSEGNENAFRLALQESLFLNLKKQTETLFRKLSGRESKHPLALIGIERL